MGTYGLMGGAVLCIVLSIICFKNEYAKIGLFLLAGGLLMLFISLHSIFGCVGVTTKFER